MLNLKVMQMQIPSKPHQVIFVCNLLFVTFAHLFNMKIWSQIITRWTWCFSYIGLLCDLWKRLGETTMRCSESGLLIGFTYFGIAMWVVLLFDGHLEKKKEKGGEY